MGALTLQIAPGRFDDAAREAYQRAMRHDTTGGLVSLDSVLAGAHLFDVLRGGEIVARYALRVENREFGSKGVIVAAAGGVRGADLVASMVPTIERQFSNVRLIEVVTARRALVGKLIPQGYRVEAFTVRKHLDH